MELDQAALQDVCCRHAAARLPEMSGIEAVPLGVTKEDFGVWGICCFKKDSQFLLNFSTLRSLLIQSLSLQEVHCDSTCDTGWMCIPHRPVHMLEMKGNGHG